MVMFHSYAASLPEGTWKELLSFPTGRFYMAMYGWNVWRITEWFKTLAGFLYQIYQICIGICICIYIYIKISTHVHDSERTNGQQIGNLFRSSQVNYDSSIYVAMIAWTQEVSFSSLGNQLVVFFPCVFSEQTSHYASNISNKKLHENTRNYAWYPSWFDGYSFSGTKTHLHTTCRTRKPQPSTAPRSGKEKLIAWQLEC